MRFLIFTLLFATACEKTNPNLCCIDAADCASVGLDDVRPCSGDKVCRGNVCVVEQCTDASNCDASAPYCIGSSSCQESCTDDSQCPGFGEPASSRFCEGGTCVACRANADCPVGSPVCNAGGCEKCDAHADCASGVCTADGTCGLASDIAYVSPTGSASSECTEAAPCSTIEHALGLLPSRLYIVLASGTYTRSGPLAILDRRFLIGRGTIKPVIDRADDGPIVTPQGPSELHLENVMLSGGTGAAGTEGSQLDGYAIYCRVASGVPTIVMRDVEVTNNSRGVGARQCKLDIQRSRFTSQNYAIETTDVTAKVDRVYFDGSYLSLDGGLYTFTNNVVARAPFDVSFYTTQAGSIVEFNTFVDTNFLCGAQVATAFPNNIFARGGTPTTATCSFPNSIIAPSDISAIKFAHPDSAPYDYHLLAGSSAIDAAGTSTMDHDFDGDARPKGAGRDVGADEAQ